MKYFIYFMVFFTPLACNAIEFEVTKKQWAELSQKKLKELGHKIIDIVSLDTDMNGYVKIIYE